MLDNIISASEFRSDEKSGVIIFREKAVAVKLNRGWQQISSGVVGVDMAVNRAITSAPDTIVASELRRNITTLLGESGAIVQ